MSILPIGSTSIGQRPEPEVRCSRECRSGSTPSDISESADFAVELIGDWRSTAGDMWHCLVMGVLAAARLVSSTAWVRHPFAVLPACRTSPTLRSLRAGRRAGGRSCSRWR